MQSPIELVVFLQAYLFSTLRLSSGLSRPVFVVPSYIAMQALQKWIDDNVDVTADHCDVVKSIKSIKSIKSKPLLDAMRNAVSGLKNAHYGNHLRTIGAFRDQMHIPGTGTVGIYREIMWKTQPVDNTDNNKRAIMEAWLDKFFDCTGSTTNRVKKKPTLDHALQHFRARRSDISLFLERQGFKKGTEGGAQIYYGLTFKPRQGSAETSSAEEDAPDTPTPALAGRHTTLSEAMASWRKKGFRRRHASSKTHVVLWCATNLAKLGSDHVPKCRATVHVRYGVHVS